MIDLGREIEGSVRADWSEQRRETVHAGLRSRRRRRVVARTAFGTAGIVAVLVAGWKVWPVDASDRSQPIAVRSNEQASPLRFDDGSIAIPGGDDSRLRVIASIPGHVVVELAAGSGRFEVVDDRTRVFSLSSGSVKVETFGAVFGCFRSEAQTRIEVVRGTVRVMWDDQQRELTTGELGVFPPTTPMRSAVPANRSEPTPATPRQPSRIVENNWRELAHDGDYDKAYDALERGAPVRDKPEELLLLADVKRLSHHPAEAIAPLSQIVRDHARDPRASLAAFTLGRVLLEELGRPAEAAAAFAAAVRLAPGGPMAEDAIARQVEALSRSGDATAARRLAADYLERFPDGRKVRSVRRFGGLE